MSFLGCGGLVQAGHKKALIIAASGFQSPHAVDAESAVFQIEAGRGGQRFQLKAEFVQRVAHLFFVFAVVGGAGGIDQCAAGTQQAAGLPQQSALEPDQGGILSSFQISRTLGLRSMVPQPEQGGSS